MHRFKHLIRKPWFWAATGIPLVYAIFGFVAVPGLIRHYAPPAVHKLIQRPLSFGEISFNPFLFRLDAHDISLSETDGKPIVAIQRLYVDFELAKSILNRAPTFGEFRLEGPAVNLVEDKDGVLNMAKIAASLPPEDPASTKPPEDEGLPSLIIKRIVLSEGEIAFENQSFQPPDINRADHLGLDLRNFSTLPERHGLYEIDAALPEGGNLRWEGDVSLNPVKSSGTLSLQALKVATLWHFAQNRVALSEPAGDIALSAHYQFGHDKQNTSLTINDAVFKLAGLKLATAETQVPLAELESFQIDKVQLDLGHQTVTIPDITLQKGKLSAIYDSSGQLNWQTVARPVVTPPATQAASPTNPPASATSPAEPSTPWSISLGQLSLKEFGLEYGDQRPASLTSAKVNDIGLTLKADAAVGAGEPAVHVKDLGLRLQGIGLNQNKTPVFALDGIQLDQVSIDLPEQKMEIPNLSISKGKLSGEMDASGQLNWQKMLPPAKAADQTTPATNTPSVETAGVRPWTVNLAQFSLNDFGLDLKAGEARSPVQAGIANLGLTLNAQATAGGTADPVVHVGNLALRLQGIGLNQGKTPLLALDDIRLEQVSVDLPEQTLTAPRLLVSKGRIAAQMDAAGQLNWEKLLPPAPAAAAPPQPTPPTSKTDAKPAKPWNVALGLFNLSDIALGYSAVSDKAPMEAAINKLGLSFSAKATAGGPAPAIVQLGDIGLHLNKISLDQGKSPLLKLDDISVDKALLNLPAQTLRIPLFKISNGRVNATIDSAGVLNWQKLAPPQPVTKPTKAAAPQSVKAKTEQAWQVALDQFKLSGLALQVDDLSHSTPIRASLGDIGLALKADALAGNGPVKAHVNNLGIQLDRLTVDDTASPATLVKWDSLKIQDGRIDLEKQDATIRSVALKGGGTAITREANGSLYPVSIFESPDKPETSPLPVANKPLGKTQAQTRPEKPWQFALGELTVNDFGIGIKDRSQAVPLAYDLEQLAITARNIASSGDRPVSFNLRTRIRQGGQLQLEGTAAPSGKQAKSSIKLDGFDLIQLQPFISEYVALNLNSANLSSNLALDFKQANPSPQIRVTGDANLARLKLTESKDGDPFLGWSNLATKGIDFSLAPDKLSIKELRITEPDSVVAIHKDKTTNISDIVKKQPTASQKPKAAPSPAVKPAPPFPVSIGRILVEKGKVDFSDASLLLPFATRIHDFGGSIAGFNMSPQARANVQLAGRVDQYGEARVEGSLTPMDIKKFSDISVIFNNVTLSSLSPYSATFAGRKIESGKLDLDLRYNIEASQLKSQNKITLEQFKLGEKVESPNATNLPLDLAIALLTDSEGKIQASVPVVGTMDDPKFAIGPVVWDAISTMITNAVKAPFTALASLAGGGQADSGTVAFDPGRASIPPPEREKLQKLAKMLAGRAQLKLLIHGGVDPKADLDALKSIKLRYQIARQLNEELGADEVPDSVNVTDPASQRALEKLAEDAGVSGNLVAAYQKEKGRQPNRVGAMSGLFGQASTTPDYYESVVAYLEQRINIPPSELDAVADQRAKAIHKELVEQHKLDRNRLTIGKNEPVTMTPEKRIPVKLELNTN